MIITSRNCSVPRCWTSNYQLWNFQTNFSFVGDPLDVDVCLAALLGDNQMIHCPSTLRGYSTKTLLKHFFTYSSFTSLSCYSSIIQI